jgi:hypothetical protein
MAVWFDSNGGNGAGTSISDTRNTFTGFGTNAITETNCVLYIKAGSNFNISTAITNQNGFTNNKIVIEKYGTGADPVLHSTQSASSLTGWTECNAAAAMAGTLTAQAGSNVWHKAGMGSGWLLGDAGTGNANGTHWGNLRYDYTVGVGTAPSADYHIALVSIGGTPGTLFYGDDIPWTYYGGTYALTVDSMFHITQPRGGFECYGIAFGHSTQYSIDIGYGTYGVLCDPVIISECGFINTQAIRVGSGVSNRTNNTGTRGLIIEKCYAENIGNSFIGTWGAGAAYNGSHVFNNTHIRQNVINGVCKRFSLGGIYLLNCRTNDGSKIKVYDNTVSDAMRDNVWPDGYAIYSDFSAQDIEFYRNYVWNSDLAFRNNGVSGNARIYGNVAVAKAGASASSSAFGSNDPNSVNLPANIELAYNVAVGFNRFAGYQNIVSGSRFNLHHNVSIAKSGGGGTQHAVDVRGPTGMTLDRNNFYGYSGNHWHDYDAFDGAAGDISSQATNKITSNPASALSKIILTPTDPTFNYALTLPKMDDWTTTPAYESAPRLTKA